MVTYRFRFKFSLSHKGMIKGDDKEIEFKLPNGHEATLSCIDAESFKDSLWFAVISGGYASEDTALKYGHQFKEAALCFGAKYRMGIDIGKDKARGGLFNHVKDNIFQKHGTKVVDDIHGVTAYSEEFPATCFSISGNVLVAPRESDFFTTEIYNLIEATKNLDEKIRTSMELITASYFDTSPRSRFLTLILAAEALLKPEKRQEETTEFITSLIKQVKESGIDSSEKTSIEGSLNWLYYDSISKSLKKMAITHLKEKSYNESSPEKFIAHCYDARSKLVHTGSLEKSKHDLGGLVGNLEIYMRDMITKIAHL